MPANRIPARISVPDPDLARSTVLALDEARPSDGPRSLGELLRSLVPDPAVAPVAEGPARLISRILGRGEA
jgi:hypothetical protein